MKASPIDEIASRLARAQERIAAAAKRSGRSPNDIELVAVSKTHAAGIDLLALAQHMQGIAEAWS